MPILTDPGANFVHGLSDFWVTIFRDRERLEALYGAQQVLLGQLYLDLLNDVLDVSLDHAPLFSTRYFLDLYVREDRLTFLEGAAPADDRWLHVDARVLGTAPALMNRVVAPTAVVEAPTGYEVAGGAVLFHVNPLDDARFDAFPVRTLDVAFAAALGGHAWEETEARPGDRLAWAGEEMRVAGTRPGVLLLDAVTPTLAAARPGTARVLRRPSDAVKTNVPVTSPTAAAAVTLGLVAGTKTATVAGADATWNDTYVYFVSPLARETGLWRVVSGLAGVVTLDVPADFGVAAPVAAWHLALASDVTDLPHAALRRGTLALTGRRVDTGAALVEGVDYDVDYAAGVIRARTPWNPATPVRANYTWDLVVATVAYAGAPPVVLDAVHPTRELVAWAPDAKVDRDTLYRNFGYLLGFRRPSSEAYRTFLRGVTQLYLRGASLTRFASALNVLVGYPVAREDGEVVVAIDDGVAASGVDGEVTDSRMGRDGALDPGTSRFTATTAGFLSDDVDAVLDVDGVIYVVTTVVSATMAVVTPPPPATATNVRWRYSHVGVRRRFASPSAAFTDADVDADLVLATGTYRITAVEHPRAVCLDGAWDLADATGLAWRLTRTRAQRLTTTRHTYVLPFGVPLTTATTLAAFAPLTRAFVVTDHVADDTWWHHATVPPELTDDGRVRVVSPGHVPHVFGALDAPRYGDPGLVCGADEEGVPGVPRAGAATWLGGPWVTLGFGADLSPRDLGSYLVVTTPGFAGSYRVAAYLPDLVTLRLERFPPPEAGAATPPALLAVLLPARVYRRPGPFVLMDRWLKRHAFTVTVDPAVALPPGLSADLGQLVTSAKPAHLYAYVAPQVPLADGISLGETLAVEVDPHLRDRFDLVDGALTYGPGQLPQLGDAFVYTDESFPVAYPGGSLATTLTPTPPAGPYVADRWVFTFLRCTVGTNGTRRLAEGADADYDFDRATGALTLRTGDAGALTFVGTVCWLRTRLPGDPLVATETRLAHGGGDPTKAGFVDHPVSITLV